MKNRLLFTVGFGKTERLEGILKGEINPTSRDIRELWSVLKGSEGYTGEKVVLEDLKWWIENGCEVMW